jgi:replication factor C small subunit
VKYIGGETMSRILIDETRPKVLDEVVGQEKIVKRLKAYVENKHCPHMIFMGKPGIGKTTCAKAFIYELYGESYRINLLELNASDEGGINTIRTKVKNFSKTIAVEAPFKIVFLDEADHLTEAAQATLRRMMEDYSKTTRFILSCNYPYKIIEPIKDRCAIYRFKLLSEHELFVATKKVLNKNKIDFEGDGLNLIIKQSRGSMRKALNIIESISIGKPLTTDYITSMIDEVMSKDDIIWLIEAASNGDARGIHEKIYELTRAKDISPEEIVNETLTFVEESDLSHEEKMKIAWTCGEYDWRIAQGANPEVQLSCMFREFINILE